MALFPKMFLVSKAFCRKRANMFLVSKAFWAPAPGGIMNQVAAPQGIAIDCRGLGKMLLKPGTFLALFRQNAFETRKMFLVSKAFCRKRAKMFLVSKAFCQSDK